MQRKCTGKKLYQWLQHVKPHNNNNTATEQQRDSKIFSHICNCICALCMWLYKIHSILMFLFSRLSSSIKQSHTCEMLLYCVCGNYKQQDTEPQINNKSEMKSKKKLKKSTKQLHDDTKFVNTPCSATKKKVSEKEKKTTTTITATNKCRKTRYEWSTK